VPLRKQGKPAAYLAVAAAGLALFGAVALFLRQLGAPTDAIVQTTRWLPSDGHTIAEIGVRLDGISVPMLVVVTTVAFSVRSSRSATWRTSRRRRSVGTSATTRCSSSA